MKSELHQELEKKVEYEYERFTMSVLASSKENIFAVSEEIELKKAIRKYLLQATWKDEDIDKLLQENNFLEAVYRYVVEEYSNRIIARTMVLNAASKLIR